MIDNFLVIIQARMGSKRFPGKTLYELSGKPSLAHLLDSVNQIVPKKNIVIASSEASENDAIEEYCKNESLECVRGDEENVASRFYEIIKKVRPSFFVRLNADSPLFDYRVLEKTIDVYRNEHPDIVTTILERTFPTGTNCEIIDSNVFLINYEMFRSPDHFEHVTRYFYDHAEDFEILNVESGVEGGSKVRLSFDTKEDYEVIRLIFDKMEKPHYEYSLEEKCDLYYKAAQELGLC